MPEPHGCDATNQHEPTVPPLSATTSPYQAYPQWTSIYDLKAGMEPGSVERLPYGTAADDQTMPPAEISPGSSSTSNNNARLTPDSESGESDIEMDELGESYKLQRRERDVEKTTSDDHDKDHEDDDDEGGHTYHDSRARQASISTVQSYQLYTPDEERAVVRKFDRKLVLFVALLYMLSFLDRSNIGNAKIAGLVEDLKLDSNKYEWVITAFYISYISFEWMSILWKLIPAHIYVTVIVLSWGIVASLQAVTTSFGGLLVLRVLLGIGEAGFTGIPFYLSFFFKREELALRTGLFISAAPLATSFASTLAWAIIKLGKHSPIASWRLLFLLEGFPSVVVAVVAWRTIPDSPSTARYLSKREQKIARLRLRRQNHPVSKTQKGELRTSEMLATLIDPKSYLTAFMFFFTNMAFSSMPVFLPTIIHEMGHSVLISQALSAPPYLLSFVVVIVTAYLSDRWQSRSLFICFHALLSASGYAFISIAGARGWSTWARYAGIFPACLGFFSVITIIVTWTINNQESESKQGTGFAMLQLIGQCGPLVGTRLYPEKDAPLYLSGMASCAGAMVVVAVLSIFLRFYLARKNRKMESIDYGALGEEMDTFVPKARQQHPVRFTYML